MPLTWTSAPSSMPPACGNATCQVVVLRASEICFSQVTPNSRIASAAITVAPTWISVLRLTSWSLRWLALSDLDRPFAGALDELTHQRIRCVARLLRRSGEDDPALVQHRHTIGDLER